MFKWSERERERFGEGPDPLLFKLGLSSWDGTQSRLARNSLIPQLNGLP